MSISFYAGKSGGDSVIDWVFTREEMTPVFYNGANDLEGAPNPAYRPELDVNMTNRNAAYVLSCLGIALADGYFQVPVDEMTNRCTNLLKTSIRKKRLGIEQKPDGPMFIDCGIDEGYVEKQVLRIAILAREGKARGAEVIYGC